MVNGKEDGVTLKKDATAKELLCSAPKNSLLFFHNHPKNTWFSEKDLESFMTSDAIMMMSIVCNNGRLYFLLKMETFNKDITLAEYDRIYENTDNSSVSEFLRISSSIGLKFIYGGESHD